MVFSAPVSHLLRFTSVAFIVAGYLAVYGFGRLWLVGVRDKDALRSRRAALQGRVLRRAMERLGATFIKLGQVMSSRPDLFEPETIDELRRLQDQLPPFALRHVERIAEEDLGRPVRELFHHFEPEPIAAASVAQVHRAVLADGREVAVKVLRPSVRRRVMRDAAILRSLAKVAAWHPTLRLSDPVGHVGHFVQGIEEQTDLRRELDNYGRFRANFAAVEGVIFPAVHAELCGPRILTMDLIKGFKIDALVGDPDHGLDVTAIARTMRNAFFKMCFEDGFVHADLHPGNMLVTPAGEVAIFDVGLAKEMSGDVFDQTVDFARCISFGDLDDFVRHLQTFHGYMDGTDWAQIRLDASQFVGRFRGKTQDQLEWSAMFDDVFKVMRRHHIRPLPDVILVMVGVVTAEGVGKQLESNIDTLGEMAAYLMPILARRNMMKASRAS